MLGASGAPASTFGASPWGEVARWFFATFRLPKQFAVRHTEVVSQSVENVEGGVAKLTLDFAEVGPIDLSVMGQPFLRYSRSALRRRRFQARSARPFMGRKRRLLLKDNHGV